jgi:hypothetical protein
MKYSLFSFRFPRTDISKIFYVLACIHDSRKIVSQNENLLVKDREVTLSVSVTSGCGPELAFQE